MPHGNAGVDGAELSASFTGTDTSGQAGIAGSQMNDSRPASTEGEAKPVWAERSSGGSIYVTVNGAPVCLSGKPAYVFVDVFQYIDFDLSKPQGSGIVTRLNDRDAKYMETIHDGDKIDIYWKH